MKKLVACAILVIMLCFTMCGCGSKNDKKAVLEGDFIIHSGVQFGDTIEEVEEKETLELVSEDLRKKNPDFIQWLTYKGELAGYPNSSLFYYYDDDGKIFRAIYSLFYDTEEMKKTKGKGIYDNVNKMLVEKYGNPISENDYRYLTVNDRIKELESREALSYEVNVWLLEYKTYYIETILYKKVEDEYETSLVEYIYHSKEEIQSKKEEIKNSDNKVIDDL